MKTPRSLRRLGGCRVISAAVAFMSLTGSLPRSAAADEVFSETTTTNGPEGGAGQVYDSGPSHLSGRIVGVRDSYHLLLRDSRNQLDQVTLRPGTTVFPRHLALQAGMVVSIYGSRGRNYFLADEIDTPYDLVGGVPYYRDQPWGNYGNDMSLAEYYGASGWWQRNQRTMTGQGSHRGAHSGGVYSHANSSGAANNSGPVGSRSGRGPGESANNGSNLNGSGSTNSGSVPNGNGNGEANGSANDGSSPGGANQSGNSVPSGGQRVLENPATNGSSSTAH